MPNSMTGFGRGEAVADGRRFLVEIRTVNNRYCDIQVRMPRTIASLETRVREAVAASGASSARDIGKVMPLIMPRVKGKADGKLVNTVVKRVLGG